MFIPQYQGEVSGDCFLPLFKTLQSEVCHGPLSWQRVRRTWPFQEGTRIPLRWCVKIVAVKQYAGSRRRRTVVFSGLLCRNYADLRDFEAPRIHEMLRVSTVINAWASISGLIEELIVFLFWDWMATVALANEGRVLQTILKSKQKKTKTAFVNMSPFPTILGVITFSNCLSELRDGLQEKCHDGSGVPYD